MSVPPAGGQSASTPPSKGKGPDGKAKEFKLPDKKEEQKLQEVAADAKQEQIEKETISTEEVKTTEKVGAMEAKAQVSAIGKLIQKMATEMQVGKDFASVTLKAGEVPKSFAGANLTMSYKENNLVVRFEQFQTPQQEANATKLVDQHKEELVDVIRNLQARQVNLTQLNIGDTKIELPRVEPLPPPFQVQTPAEMQPEQGQGESDRGEEGEGGGPK